MAQYRAATGGGLRPVLLAPSGHELPFGVAIYTARNGKRCAAAGQARGSSLGIVQGGAFLFVMKRVPPAYRFVVE